MEKNQLSSYVDSKPFVNSLKGPIERFQDLPALVKAGVPIVAIIALCTYYNASITSAIQTKAKEITGPTWEEITLGKIDGIIPLATGERLEEEVEVVPSGFDGAATAEMAREGTKINIRTSPNFAAADNTVGKVDQGTKIKDVLRNTGKNGYVAFKCNPTYLSDKVKKTPPNICVISGDYAKNSVNTQKRPGK